jgi:hypothetical protein
MMVDNALAIPQVILGSCGDARLGKGRTQKFRQSEFTRLVEAGQVPAWYGNLYSCREFVTEERVRAKPGMDND